MARFSNTIDVINLSLPSPFNSTNTALYGHRMMRFHCYDMVKEAKEKFIRTQDPNTIAELIASLSQYGNVWRSEGCDHEALRLYEHLLHNILEDIHGYPKATQDVLMGVDKTEIYFNLGYLTTKQGDLDLGLHWLGEADKEQVRVKKTQPGEFLRKLIDEEGSPFWNFTTNIIANCSNFMPGYFGAFEFLGVFGRELTSTDVQAFLRDMEVPLLIQYVHTMETFLNNFSRRKGVVRFLRMSRTIGELGYVADCYLGSKRIRPNSTLGEKLTALAANDQAVEVPYTAYMNALSRPTSIADYNMQISNLIQEIESVVAGPNKWAYILVLLLKLRNATAHYLDDQFILNAETDPMIVKKSYLSIVMAFFITRKLLGLWSP